MADTVQSEDDDAVIDALHEKLVGVLQDCNGDWPDKLQAALLLVGTVVLNIGCPDCRKKAKRHSKHIIPAIMRDIESQRADMPDPDEHVH